MINDSNYRWDVYSTKCARGGKYEYKIHLAYGIAEWGSQNEGEYDDSEIYSLLFVGLSSRFGRVQDESGKKLPNF